MLKCLGLLWSHCECETHTVNVKAVGLTVLAVSYWLCYSDVGLKSVPSTFRKGTHTVSKKTNKHGNSAEESSPSMLPSHHSVLLKKT